jgi:hypothetical protein
MPMTPEAWEWWRSTILTALANYGVGNGP